MRQGPNGRRGGRGRPHGGGNSGGNGNGNGNGNHGNHNQNGGNRRSTASLRHQTFDSNGPDVRVRGNAWQVHEKYQALARDAAAAGDRVAAENYLQHAEHYYRIIEAINEATAAEQRTRGFGPNAPQPDFYQPPTGGENQPAFAPQPATVSGQAEVTMRTPQPPQPQQFDQTTPGQAEVQAHPMTASSFFSSDEVAEHETVSGVESLVASR